MSSRAARAGQLDRTRSVGDFCLSGVMHLTTALEELTGAELLDHADEVARTQRECEVQVLRIAVQVAVLNNPDTLDPEVSALPGRERVRRFVNPACPTSRSSRRPRSVPGWASRRGPRNSPMADALDLMIRLPQLWRRVRGPRGQGAVPHRPAPVARRTRDLSADQASYVDERAAESADGRIPWSRFEDLVTGLVVASDPEAAAQREQRQRRPSGRQPHSFHRGRDARLLHPRLRSRS